MFMAYHLPADYPRPTLLSERDCEFDRAIECLVAGRMQNYGETDGDALRTIVWKGPGDAAFGILIDDGTQKSICRWPSRLRDRAANAWGVNFPDVQEANRLRATMKRDRLESLGFLLDRLISWWACRPGSRRFERMGYRYGRNCYYLGRSLSRIWNH